MDCRPAALGVCSDAASARPCWWLLVTLIRTCASALQVVEKCPEWQLQLGVGKLHAIVIQKPTAQLVNGTREEVQNACRTSGAAWAEARIPTKPG
jgi:hypothetical protein